ncbi:RNA polymerase sigma factor [Nesterenkonia sp. NBAIMH1]|uniref:RNA polymerase sigma factor n=1 Tax=Nesterenkonia sp. NBAIMH1 TaxID=2600320 RepID=UPI0011B7054C|nr:sigma-70 family RNA polymerase sigma factor [Nesterenkonia sp. NBAIMH1]
MRELFAAHGSLIFSLCLSALRHRQDAEDAAQQVFVRAWRFRESYDPAKPPGAWLTGIARRVITDTFHARQRNQRSAEAGGAAFLHGAPDQPIETVVDQVTVHQAISELGPPQDEILRMAYGQDLPVRTISERLSMPVGTVKSHMHRGLARLRRTLEVTHD